MTGWDVAWARGGEARVIAAGRETIALVSTVPSPPGSRMEGHLHDATKLWVKIHASRRQEDGTFRLEGRPLDLTREVRARLQALVEGRACNG